MNAQIYGTKLNAKDPQIKTWSVQRTLDPLVAQVRLHFNMISSSDLPYSGVYRLDLIDCSLFHGDKKATLV
jgi:hypothetical protein